MGKDDFGSTTLFNGKILLLAVDVDHPNKALQAAFDGALRFVQRNLPDRKTARLHLKVEGRRSKIMALVAQGMNRQQIAKKLFPDEMGSKVLTIRKRALQRVTDALRPRKK
jgi:hypothetical protein